MNQEISQVDKKFEIDNKVKELESYWQRYVSLLKNNKKNLFIFGFVVLGLVLGGVSYFLKIYHPTTKKVVIVPEATSEADYKEKIFQEKESKEPSEYLGPNTDKVSSNLLEGKIVMLDGDLGLFNQIFINNAEVPPVYYEAGNFIEGSFNGYKRIIGIIRPQGPGRSIVFVFVTKDNKNYLTEKSGDEYSDEQINLDKVSFVSEISSQHPAVIDLDDQFVLLRKNIPTVIFQSSFTDSLGQGIYRSFLKDEFSDAMSMASGNSYVGFLIDPYYSKNYREGEIDGKDIIKIRGEYLGFETNVLVTDSTGLVYTYSLATAKDLARYDQELSQYKIDYQNYKIKQKDYQEKTEKGLSTKDIEYPMPPDRVVDSGLNFDISQIESTDKLFNKYSIAFPAACGVDSFTYVLKNIDESDLSPIGTTYIGDVWKFKDPNHLLLQLEYKIKVEDTNDDWFLSVNDLYQKPTYEEYVAQNPLLIIKDPWERYVVMGEWDYIMEGGCGKPVVYLYPEEETEVSVSFLSDIDLTTDIPNYDGEWHVLAQPNGTIRNLKKNNCLDADFEKFGSEYALEACQKNEYPYLYWAGNSIGNTYQPVDSGWIVARDEVAQFLEKTLLELGLTQKETTDMVSYWVPQMLATNVSHFKIGFLQTREMNELAPMQITPTPDSIFRIFLDWYPLTGMPDQLPEPQNLDRVQRDGFTVIEWGGLHH